jgi:chemotaxis protein histidine kinase CheA
MCTEVDEILGVRQVVLKPLASEVNSDSLFLGAATLGDGNVAMVLDTGKLVEVAMRSGGSAARPLAGRAESAEGVA